MATASHVANIPKSSNIKQEQQCLPVYMGGQVLKGSWVKQLEV